METDDEWNSHFSALMKSDFQEGDRRRVELALLSLDEERVFQQTKQNHPDVLHMVLQRLGEDQDVIDVHEDEAVKHVP